MRRFLLLLLLLLGGAPIARAALQFDVFLGYDGLVPEASWFPIVCEVKNDGPTFVATIEIESGAFNQSQTRRVRVELPTGTLKRLSIPVFSTARYQSRWDVRLLDERGKVRAEQAGVQPKRQIPAQTTVLGALPRTPGGLPVIRQIAGRDNNGEMQPGVARLQSQLLPDDPLVYEGMNSIYLNSEKAMELSAGQVEALLTWLNNGGHLIVGVEQIGDVNSVAWLKRIVPCTLTDVHTVASHGELQRWIRGAQSTDDTSSPSPQATARPNRRQPRGPAPKPFADLPEDPGFESAPLQVAVGKVHGQVLVACDGVALIVRSTEGRGRVTALLFSPEREPARAWKNLPTFWAQLTEVNPALYVDQNFRQNGGWSVDGIFGAMIDSKQVRKLPVEWLLLLLIVYLVVIGPLDQYWLKRIKRPMLTWVTFPCYVVLFSLLIYFIGYKLRAGESEWNELHLVDVLVKGEGADLRGRTYASIYSPVNQSYRVESQLDHATFRGEFQSSWSGGQETERADVFQNGDNFKAEIFVPVWTSQLYEADWWQSSDLPLNYTITTESNNWVIKVTNKLNRKLEHAHVVVPEKNDSGLQGRVLELGELPPGQTKTFTLKQGQGMQLRDFVNQHGGNFQSASQSRQHAFGNSGSGQIPDLPNASMAVSFISHLADQQMRFITPPGLDLTPLLGHGNAILLAWTDDYSPIQPINRFTPRRAHKQTLWRMAAPVNGAAAEE